MGIGKSELRIAIVGFGPRGLGALEALAVQATSTRQSIAVDIFDPFKWPGAGPNYDPEQDDHCILNIPLRSLDIAPPPFLASRIGSFEEWSARAFGSEVFPPRSAVGAYFHARFEALVEAMSDLMSVTHTPQLIIDLDHSEEDWCLHSACAKHDRYDEVLLTQGQPETAPDPQVKKWMDHADRHVLELLASYPANTLLKAAQNWSGKTVAIRGLSLSTFDVLRMLTSGLGGEFGHRTYRPSGLEPRKILPFSFNGLPPAPKPATEDIDRLFDPTQSETSEFQHALEKAMKPDCGQPLETICEGLVAPATRILTETGASATGEDTAPAVRACSSCG